MDLNKDTVILITGAARRIGKAIALSLAPACLIIHYHQSKQEAEALCKELTALGSKCLAYQADLTQEDEIENMFLHIEQRFKKLDILINSAASFQEGSLTSSPELIERLRLNVFAPIYCAQKAKSLMTKESLVINLIDTSAKHPIKGYEAHSFSKATLDKATSLLAKELAPQTRVNTLLMGIVMPSDNFETSKLQEIIDQRVLLKRAMLVKELTHAIRFIIENGYLNATTLELDGGWI